MADQELKSTIVVAAEDQTKSTFQEIKSGAKEMANSVKASGEEASKGLEGMGKEARKTSLEMDRAEISIAKALQSATEKTKIAAQAGESLTRAFEQKIELRGLDASKLNPFVQQLREAENALAAVKAQQAQQSGQNAFLDSLRSQADVIGKTKTELLELKAAQLGMSTAAAPYIAKLREAEAGIGRVGVSAGQTRAALAQLPMQFSDIVVSLQGGQAPLTVFIQQFSQIKDSFGGAGAAAKAMGSYILGLVNPYTAAAAAVALLGFAYYQGSKEVDAYRKSLVLSGNQAGTSIDQLNAMARAMADSVGTQGRAAAGLAEMAQKSKVGSDNLKEFTTSAIQWEKATGQAVSETAKQFADLANDPLKASLALNEQMNFLTVSTYDQIKALDEQGKKEEAAAIAQKAYSDAMKSRSGEIVQNLGYVERAYKAVGGVAAWAWDQIAGIGRPTTPMDDFAKNIDRLQERLTEKLARGPLNGQTTDSYQKGIDRLKKEIESAKGFLGLMTSADTFIADQQKTQKDYIDAAEEFDRTSGQFASKETKRKQELTVAENQYNKAVEATKKAFAGTPELAEKLADLESKYQKTQEGINKRFTEKSGSSARRGENEMANIRALIAQEDEMIQRYQTRGAAAEKMTDAEKLLSRLESQRAETSNKTIRAEKERAIVEAQKLVAKQAYRKELEAAAKAEEDQNEANRKSIEAMLKSAAATKDEAERIEVSLHVYGKARTEIERLTLAKLEQKKVDMDGLASPEAMAAIQARIDAQKELVESLQKLDYKKLDDKLSKSLETSKEELAIQRDGLSLLGLDEVQRKKIIAQRKIELELAKQIAEIDRAKFSDDAEVNEQQKDELRKKARLKAETDTQTAILKIQEEYVNQQVQQYDEVFRRGFADMLNNGKDGWDAFTKSLTTTFKTTVADQIYKMFLRPFVVQVVAQMVGVTGKGSEFSGMGASGVPNLMSGSLTDWSGWGSSAGDWLMTQSTKLGLNGMTSMGDAAFALGDTIKGVDSYLKGVPGLSGGIGSAAGYLGSVYALTQGKYGSAVGSAIGTYILPGIGTMIGGVLGGLVDGMFGSGGTKEYGGTAMYSAALGAQASTTHGAFGTGFGGVDANEQILANVSGISKSIVDALDATAKSFGKTVGYEAAAGFASDFGDDATWGGLRIALGGKDIVNWDETRTSKWAPKEFASGEEGYKQYLNAVALDVKTALLGMDLPGWANQLVSAANDLDGINAALQQVGAVRAMFDSLGQSMQMFAGISGDLQTQLLKAFGSVDAFSTSVGEFYQGFFSEQERMEALQKQLRESLSGLGIGIDPSLGEHAKEQFRATVEAAMAGGKGELAAQLLTLSGSFATAADYAQKSADDSVARLNEIMGQQHMLYADLAEAEGDYATAAQRRYWVETAGMNQAEQAAYDYIAAIRQQVSAAQALKQLSDTRWSLENDLLTGQGNTSEVARRQRERDLAELTKGMDAEQAAKIAAAYDYNVALRAEIEAQRAASEAAQQAAQAQQAAADKIRSSWQSIGDSVLNEINRIRGLVIGDSSMGLDYYQAQFAIATGQARAGDQDAAQRLAEISQAMLGVAQSGALSMFELQRLRATTASSLESTLEEIQKKFGISVNLPKFDVGTNFVPRDMVAQIHQGEAIVPKAFNPWAGGSMAAPGSNAELVAAVNRLTAENAKLAGLLEAIERNTGGLPQMVDQFDRVAESGRVRVAA